MPEEDKPKIPSSFSCRYMVNPQSLAKDMVIQDVLSVFAVLTSCVDPLIYGSYLVSFDLVEAVKKLSICRCCRRQRRRRRNDDKLRDVVDEEGEKRSPVTRKRSTTLCCGSNEILVLEKSGSREPGLDVAVDDYDEVTSMRPMSKEMGQAYFQAIGANTAVQIDVKQHGIKASDTIELSTI
jgi:hypothetical protein